jgi:tocopherol O-methyltransferase
MSQLNERIKTFYDDSSQLWIERWGEHMHHGYYGSDGKIKKDRLQAQEDMIQELLNWAEIKYVKKVLDLGCGVGGSSRFMARRFGADAKGVTLSPVQAAIAKSYNNQQNLQDKVNISVQDMMSLNVNSEYDLVWSMESAEHISDKAALMQLCFDSLSSNGKLIMATWCVREERSGYTVKEKKLLDKVSKHYHLPPMCSIQELEILAQNAGFVNIKSADWSPAVAPFWGAVINSALSVKSIIGLMRSGWGTIKGAWAMLYMQQGYRMGLIKFGVLQGQK